MFQTFSNPCLPSHNSPLAVRAPFVIKDTVRRNALPSVKEISDFCPKTPTGKFFKAAHAAAQARSGANQNQKFPTAAGQQKHSPQTAR